ncbi:MAG: hypothetical protein HC841_02525 [Verrucomicrobiae bacterium]|nr:hypothetical protein [Verrucomicrobiae bacterium]
MPAYKNKFYAPAFVEEVIIKDDGDNAVVGTIRIKPSGVLWKPKGQQKFYSVDLEKFSAWITDSTTGAKRTKN